MAELQFGVVQDGADLPPESWQGQHKHPYHNMQVGQSILLRGDQQGQVHYWTKKTGFKFRSTRRYPGDEGNTRIWRVK